VSVSIRSNFEITWFRIAVEHERDALAVRASILDFIWFHRLGEAFPWERAVWVSYADGVMEFRLITRDPHDVITTDRATPENAYPVLDAFLMQLTGTTPAAPCS
jgi:hypothetical protein